MNAYDLAASCYLSYSGLQKLFRYVFGCRVSEYITKRRLSCAARELLIDNKSITDTAFDYQYGSPEAFSRAFKRFWGIPPNEFRKTRRFFELYPKLTLDADNGGIDMSDRKPMDVSRLYDELKKLKGSYLLSIDLIRFDAINKKYGIAAGDLVIAGAFARLERAATGDMLLFRIGGDEFVVVTGFMSVSEAEKLAREITAHNGETVRSGEYEIPLSLRVGISRLPAEPLNYRKALETIYAAIEKACEADDHVAVYTE